MNGGLTELDDLYREIILDHYRHPRNHDPLPNADRMAEGANPLCGDEVCVQVCLNGDAIERIAAWGRGCSISGSSASLMTEAVRGKPVAEAERMRRAFEQMMTEEHAEPDADLGDAEALHGVAKFPVRIKCALLPWKTLGQALENAAN